MMGSLYYPAFAAKMGVADMNQIASIKYVKVPYSAIPDAEVKISDDDIKAFMNKHKAIYQTEQATRSIEYVSFDIIPASADSAHAKEYLEALRTELAASKDEHTYVGTKTDDQNGSTEAFLNKTTFTSRYADTIMSQPVGSIYGPYMENGNFKMTKVVDKKVLPDSIKARHILIVVKNGAQEILSDTLAHKRIDSIAAAIKAGASFDSMVAKFSDDQSSKPAGGEVTFTLLQRPQISKTFGDFVFETGKVGQTEVVRADNSKIGGYTGYHLIEIKEQKAIAPCVKLATIVKSLVPSDSTDKAIYAKANDFITKSPKGADFDANVKKLGYDKRTGDNLKESSFVINGLGSARDIIKWAYTHKVGDVSEVPFTHDNQRYVVAKVSGEQAKGMMAVTAANRPMLEQRAREEKKAQMLADKYKGQSLEAIGTATSSPVTQSDTVLLGNGTISGAGFEPRVAGYAFCKDFQLNTVSPAIKGNGCVYFITVLSRSTKAEDPAAAGNALMMQKRNQEGQLRSYVQQAVTPTIVKGADIKYNISNF
jgi:peptidyl-prolyl cis-trans isomerase D